MQRAPDVTVRGLRAPDVTVRGLVASTLVSVYKVLESNGIGGDVQPGGHRQRDRSVLVAKPAVDAEHGLVSLLCPRMDLAQAMGGRPGELRALEGRGEPTAPPVATHRGEAILRPRRMV